MRAFCHTAYRPYRRLLKLPLRSTPPISRSGMCPFEFDCRFGARPTAVKPDLPGEAIQIDGLSPYTANLCPLCVWFELAGFREDFGESIGELIEAMLGRAVG